MVEVYIADTEKMNEDIASYRRQLTPGRWERANRFVFLKDRLLCVAAGLLMHRVLGVRGDDEISQDAFGKPALVASGREFNLSHSGRYCILAVGKAPLGADIERVGRADDAVAQKCFLGGELAYLYEKPGAKDRRFAELWTRKESLMKATGLGFQLPPESFCVAPMDEPVYFLNGQRWHFEQYEPDGGYAATVCAQESDFAPGVHSVDF